MQIVLAGSGGWMNRDDVAAQIAQRRLWLRPSDGQPPPSDQLRLRARQYPRLFECSDRRCTRIRLRPEGDSPESSRRTASRIHEAPRNKGNSAAASRRRRAAAQRYRPGTVKLLLVADSPPQTLDRYFYFEDVPTQDSLFRYVVRAVLGTEPDRQLKVRHLRALKDAGVFLIDLRPEPDDPRRPGDLVPDLLASVDALDPGCVILIKTTVHDAAYHRVRAAGFRVAPQRIPFPGSGRQKEFMTAMAAALEWCRGSAGEEKR